MAAHRGATDYDYVDVVTHPRYGCLTTGETEREHAHGETRSISGHLCFAEAPADPRRPAALVLVTSEDVLRTVPRRPLDPSTNPMAAIAAPPKEMRVPLGWAAVLLDADLGPRV